MIENGSKQELLNAHKDIYEVIKNKDFDRIESVIHASYFYDKI